MTKWGEVIYRRYKKGTSPDTSETLGVRPIVSLNSNVKITGGTGTADDPYRIAIQN